MKKIYRGIIALFLVVSVAITVLSTVSAEMNYDSSNNELYGCMPDDVAAVLVESGAFTTSGSMIIKCLWGYTTAVYRVLP